MTFEYTYRPSFDYLGKFSEKFGAPVLGNTVVLPPLLGQGTVTKILVAPILQVTIHYYTLGCDLSLIRLSSPEEKDAVSITFNGSGIPVGLPADKALAVVLPKRHGYTVQMHSALLGTETFLPSGSRVFFVELYIQKSGLKDVLGLEIDCDRIGDILFGNGRLIFQKGISIQELKIMEQLTRAKREGILSSLFYRIKAEELLHRFFERFTEGQRESQHVMDSRDINKMFSIRDAIILDLTVKPDFKQLAKDNCLGEGKMKYLFKQVFDDTIYNYFQKERMKEAAFLIRCGDYSVSEAGYHLGFTNLSHFIRLFTRHFGVTPKKYGYCFFDDPDRRKNGERQKAADEN